jgi:hypothetical protein
MSDNLYMKRLVFLLLAAVGMAGVPALGSTWSIAPITPPAGSHGGAIGLDIGDSGLIVGWGGEIMDTTFEEEFFWWGADGVSTAVSGTGFEPTWVSRGDVVSGYVLDESPYASAAVFENGAVRRLAMPGTTLGETRAYGINAGGDVVGYWWDLRYDQRAVVWGANGAEFLPDEGHESAASAINGAGVIAGVVGVEAGVTEPAIWVDHQVRVLDILPAGASGGAEFINDRGDILGTYTIAAEGTDYWFIYDGSKMTVLPGLNSGAYTYVYSFNNQSVAVGTSEGEAVYWEDGKVYDLNDALEPGSGWLLGAALSINDSGEIVGSGLYEGQQANFLLTSDGVFMVPEPGFVGITIIAISTLRRQGKR